MFAPIATDEAAEGKTEGKDHEMRDAVAAEHQPSEIDVNIRDVHDDAAGMELQIIESSPDDHSPTQPDNNIPMARGSTPNAGAMGTVPHSVLAASGVPNIVVVPTTAARSGDTLNLRSLLGPDVLETCFNRCDAGHNVAL